MLTLIRCFYDGVKTVFRHKLTKIGFSLKNRYRICKGYYCGEKGGNYGGK